MKREILGQSPAVKEMLSLIKRVAATKTNILVLGESGTGKELVARMIHDSGPLKDHPFVPVNCGAIPENLIESEMFGHKKGSFTGAVSEKEGLFQVANKGTLFLDEVGELPLAMQVKLLRAIQERSIRKVGGNETIQVDVRIIAATNRDLEAAVAKGTFREDLYYRLNVIQIRTPALRERQGDIGLLAEAFLKRMAQNYKREIQGFEPRAMKALELYPWPGNVRELENVIERAVTFSSGDQIKTESFPEAIQRIAPVELEATPPEKLEKSKAKKAKSDEVKEIRIPLPDFSKGPVDLDEVLGKVEKVFLLSAIKHSKGVKKKAASLLGITFRSIRYRLKKLGVKDSD